MLDNAHKDFVKKLTKLPLEGWEAGRGNSFCLGAFFEN
jgi:hypothetical protein